MSRRKRGWTSGRKMSPGSALARFASMARARASCAASRFPRRSELGELLGVELGVVRHVLLEMPKRLALLLGLVRRRPGPSPSSSRPSRPRSSRRALAGAGQNGNGQAERRQEPDQKARRTAAGERCVVVHGVSPVTLLPWLRLGLSFGFGLGLGLDLGFGLGLGFDLGFDLRFDLGIGLRLGLGLGFDLGFDLGFGLLVLLGVLDVLPGPVRQGPVRFEDRRHAGHDLRVLDDQAHLAPAVQLQLPEALAAHEGLLPVPDDGPHVEPLARELLGREARPALAQLAQDADAHAGAHALLQDADHRGVGELGVVDQQLLSRAPAGTRPAVPARSRGSPRTPSGRACRAAAANRPRTA